MTAIPDPKPADGVHAMVPRDRMAPGARMMRDAYAIVPGAPIYHREFWLMEDTLERWKAEGMPQDVDHDILFGFSPPAKRSLGQLGWCEAAFSPSFETCVLEDRGDHELVRDFAGRHVLCFKNRRSGFMPEYVDHPVKDMRTWMEDIVWRMDPSAPARYADLDTRMAAMKKEAARGMMICQNLIGGYMYLRSLIGPGELLYMFYDHPEVIHACMEAWFKLADAVIAKHQQHVTIDEIFFAEDICYNHGSLISPDMMQEFLIPYYQQIVANLRRRQIDQSRKLYVQVDTDGFCDPVIPIYRDAIGMGVMSPFEVASGSDVVRTGREYPDLVISGGFDKRILARTRADIDRMVDSIVPAMRARGGYIPTVDHGTPAEVPYENYVHFRKRMLELGG